MILFAVPFLAALLCAADVIPSAEVPADEVIRRCRAMVPADVGLSGRIILRNRKGIPQAEHDYVLTRSNAVTRLTIDGNPIIQPAETAQTNQTAQTLLGTDVTWSDLALDYLWWPDCSYDGAHESETVHGQVCSVVVMKKDDRAVKVWVDRKTGALMQAEEWRGDKPVRRLWGTRIRKFGDRWMANVLEVETTGSGHRTKITVETLK